MCAQGTQLEGQSTQLEEQSTQLERQKLPVGLQEKIGNLPPKADVEYVRSIILELCRFDMFSAQELTALLNRKSKKALVRDHLTPMKNAGQLEIVNSKAQAKNQKYRIRKP